MVFCVFVLFNGVAYVYPTHRPMDLQQMDERLENGQYQTFTDFRNDFKLIVNNCRLYNGQNNGEPSFIFGCLFLVDRINELHSKLKSYNHNNDHFFFQNIQKW